MPTALVLGLLISSPAFACFGGCGGGSDAFSYRTEYLHPGQTVTWDTSIYLDKSVAGPESGPFYAYLVTWPRRMTARPQRGRRIDAGGRGYIAGGAAQLAGRVFVLHAADRCAARHLRTLEVCNDPCSERLGYLYPTNVQMVADDSEARLSQRIDGLTLKIQDLRYQIGRVRRSTDKVASRVAKDPVRTLMIARDDALDDRMIELERAIEELESRPAATGGAPEGAFAVGALGLAAGLLLARRRKRERVSRPSRWSRSRPGDGSSRRRPPVREQRSSSTEPRHVCAKSSSTGLVPRLQAMVDGAAFHVVVLEIAEKTGARQPPRRLAVFAPPKFGIVAGKHVSVLERNRQLFHRAEIGVVATPLAREESVKRMMEVVVPLRVHAEAAALR